MVPFIRRVESYYTFRQEKKSSFFTWRAEPHERPGCRRGTRLLTELGSPGGASNVGMTENDPPAVKQLPPRGEGA